MAYKPRLSTTSPDSLDTNTYFNSTGYWTSSEDYLYKNCAAGVWQCTYHALARTCELAGRAIDRRWNTDNPIFPNRDGWPDAKNFISQSSWENGSTPKRGAIVVWSDSTAGHVGVVEHINRDGTISISNANITVDGTKRKFYLNEHTLPTDDYWQNKGLTFIGYLYNPYCDSTAPYEYTVDRNTNVDQISSSSTSVRVREDHSTSSTWLGWVENTGYYNVLDVYVGTDYTWYKIAANAWVAGVEEITFYPKEETMATPFSLYSNGTDVGAAFGKEASTANTVEFAKGINLKATSSGDVEKTINAYDLLAKDSIYYGEGGSEVTVPLNANTLEGHAASYFQTAITSSTDLTVKTLTGGLSYLTTAPTADNADGIKIVVLSSEPSTKYNGYLYLITG